MSYTPTTWTTGDTITATAMNKIEQGIANAGGVLICNSSYNGSNYVLDKTAQEIYEALLAGTPAYIKYQYGTPDDFIGELYLAPIIRFANYDYDSDIKIYASRPVRNTNSLGGKYNTGKPSVLCYNTTSLGGYPVYYAGTNVVETSMEMGGND